MTEKPKALPCPFCGKQPHILVTASVYAIECDPCGATVAEDCYTMAVLKWNRRAPDPEALAPSAHIIEAHKSYADGNRAPWVLDRLAQYADRALRAQEKAGG